MRDTTMKHKNKIAELERRVERLERTVGGPSAHEDFYSYELASPLDLGKAGR